MIADLRKFFLHAKIAAKLAKIDKCNYVLTGSAEKGWHVGTELVPTETPYILFGYDGTVEVVANGYARLSATRAELEKTGT